MNESHENLSAQQSLDLITSMIRQAQGKVSGNSFYFLLWGWCIVFANFGMYSLIRFTDYPHPYAIWLITIPAWIFTMIHSTRHSRAGGTQSHLDRITMWLWIAMGISIFPVCVFGNVIGWNINPIVLVMAAMPTFVSGVIIRFKPLLIGGICFWIGGAVCFMVSGVDQYLVGGIVFMLGYLVPGYLLRKIKG